MKITVKTVGKASYPVECEPETKVCSRAKLYSDFNLLQSLLSNFLVLDWRIERKNPRRAWLIGCGRKNCGWRKGS